VWIDPPENGIHASGISRSLKVIGTDTNRFIPTLNLANKFSHFTFSVAEHYDLFRGLIKMNQYYVKRDGVDRSV